jgi:kynureninase
MIDRKAIRALDQRDPFRKMRARFVLPKGVIYLDGNSLGALPKAAARRLATLTTDEWGRDLIASWNDHAWIKLPAKAGDKLAKLIGANRGEVVAGESTSISFYKALRGALSLNPKRNVILTEDVNFPTDLYVLDGLARDLKLKVKRVKAADVEAAIDKSVAVLALTHSNYRTSAVFDMARLNRAARKHGVVTVWDLSHSAGAMPVHLNRTRTDFAVGCGYKFLNGGPGGPGYLFVAKRHQAKVSPALPGWMGHVRPFDFSGTYRPAKGILRHLTGTPYVYGLTAFDAALDTFADVDLKALYAKAGRLGDIFLSIALEGGARFGLRPACPIERTKRGSQVTLAHPHGYAVMQALIAEGVVGDFRPPDILRFGLAPLYTSYRDVARAAERLVGVLARGSFRAKKFYARRAVT